MGDEEEDDHYPPLLISFITEILGTGILMFLGCMGCILDFGLGPVIPSFAFGLAILLIIQCFHPFGPIHINPAVSIGFVIVGKMSLLQFIVFVIAQYIGAFLGYALLVVVTPYLKNMCLLQPKLGLGDLQCFLNEIVCSGLLMILVLGALDDKGNDIRDSFAVRVGLGITGIIFSLEPFTGAGLNPARSLPPVIFHQNLDHNWLYQVGPPVGMAIAAIIYRFLLNSDEIYSLNAYLRSR